MPDCPLCSPRLSPVIAESEHWRMVLNHNQNLLGKCFLATRRHLEAVAGLSEAEWLDLHPQLGRTTRALLTAFRPDHFNYAFLQNQDRHVHLHVIPRYAEPREFAGITFADPDFPDHYAVPAPIRSLPPEQLNRLAERLRELVARPAGMGSGGEPPSRG